MKISLKSQLQIGFICSIGISSRNRNISEKPVQLIQNPCVLEFITTMLYHLSFSWQYILMGCHSMIIQSEMYVTWLLDDRKGFWSNLNNLLKLKLTFQIPPISIVLVNTHRCHNCLETQIQRETQESHLAVQKGCLLLLVVKLLNFKEF